MKITLPLFLSLLKFLDASIPSFFHNQISLIATKNHDKDKGNITIPLFSLMPQKRNFNPDRVKEIHRAIDETPMKEKESSLESNHYKILPNEIDEIIGKFEYMDSSIEYLYNLVMNKLELSMDETIKLDFDSDSFLSQLEPFLVKMNLKSKNDFFWHDISRLVFKWLIQKKQEIATNKNDADKFKLISNQLVSIASTIYENGKLPLLSNFDLDHETISNNSEFQKLVTIEIFENYSQLFPIFDSIIRDFYFNDNGNKVNPEEIKEIDCQLLKNKYFHGNYESNILLKHLLFMGDPWKSLKKCIDPNDFYSNRLEAFPLIPIIKRHSNGSEFKGFNIKGLVYTDYISKSTIDLMLSINRRFIIFNSKHLILLLKRLKESKLLTGDIIRRIINFRLFYYFSDSDPLEWNLKTFETYIEEYKRKLPLEANGERFECDEYLNLAFPARKLYNKIVDKLEMSLNDRNSLSFYNDDFVDQFDFILLGNESRFIGDISFWYNVAMLLFKWIIDRNRSKETNFKIENLLQREFPSINSMIRRNTLLKNFPISPFDFNLEFMNNSSFFILKELIDDELMMDSQILESFSSILKDYYGEENEGFDCEKMKEKYFNRGIGGFDNDPILKFTIILYDPHGMIKRECFPNQDHLMINLFNLGREIISPVDYNFNRREFERVKNPFIVNVNHVNGSIIKYFLSTNRQFQMKIMGNLELEMEKEGISSLPFHDFFILLRKLKQEIEPLTIELLMKLIKFDIPNNGENENVIISYWKEKFQELLNREMKLNPRAKNECLDYLKLLE